MSTPLKTAVAAGDIALCALIVAGLGLAARAGRRTGDSAAPAAIAIAIVVAWQVLLFALAREGAFASTRDTTVPWVIIGLAVPTVLGIGLVRFGGVRRAIERVPLPALIGVQLYRVVGALFLIAYAQHTMPAVFALPAGIGDILTGLAAVPTARLLASRGAARARTAILAWCAFGIADLIVAIATGLLSAPSSFQAFALDNPNAAITRYPFVLIPTFAVPLSIVLHAYVLARPGVLTSRDTDTDADTDTDTDGKAWLRTSQESD